MRTTALAIVLCLLVAPAMWADDEPNTKTDTGTAVSSSDEDQGNPETEEKDGKRVFKDRLVVTASRQEQSSSQTPAAISVIDAKEIEQQQPEKMADLFKDLPGVDVQGDGPFRGLPVIRGLSSNRVLILVDGQRLNNSRESTVFAGIQPGLVDLSEVDRIEVLRGPASVLYGSDAMGGVINIITKKPDLGAEHFEMSHNINYEYGSAADSSSAHADVRGSGRGWGFNLSVGWETASDFKAPKSAANSPYYSDYVFSDGTVPNSGMDQASVQGGVRFLTGTSGVLATNFEIVRTDDIGYPGFDPATSGVDISFPNFDRDKLAVRWDSGPMWGFSNVSVNSYYQHVVKDSKMFLDFGPSFYLHQYTESDVKTFGFNTQGITDLANHHLTLGLDFYRDMLNDESTYADPFSSDNNVAVPDSHQQGLGVYVQDQIQATDKLRVLAGVRGDRFNFKSENDPQYTGTPFDVTDSDISGNLGLMYAVTPNVELTAMVGRGFRAPNIEERAYTGAVSEPGYWVVQNPDLTSEKSLNYEVGFKARYDRYYGGLNVYYNDIKDFITFVDLGENPDTGLFEIAYANIEDATIKGVEIELETLMSDRWTVTTNYSYTEGNNDTTGEPLGFIPPWKVVLGLRYDAPDWWTEASARFVGRQNRLPKDETIADPSQEPPVGDFTTVDLRAGYTFGNGITLRATLGNLFDKLYSEPYNLRPEPGRYLRTSIGYRF